MRRRFSDCSGLSQLTRRGLALLIFSGLALAQVSSAPANQTNPLPQDLGSAGLREMLLRMQTTARIMQTTAHPDDEDGGMLTLESRGKGNDVLLMTLTRGEGGQNKLGSNLFDVLGVLRTLELTASDRYYGVRQRFSRVADFGFSKTAAETLEKWDQGTVPLADMVRVIRTYRPDVLISRFSGTERDGHGNHQAAGILTKRAFRAAGDPNQFPEQIKEGLRPWQAKKLYLGNVCSFGAQTCPAADWTIKLNTGQKSDALGMSYVQFAMLGLKHQLSQGAGSWTIEPGDRFTFYRLVDSTLPSTLDKDGHESDFLAGIDTSLPALATRLGDQQRQLPRLKTDLEQVAGLVSEAYKRNAADPSDAIPSLLSVVHEFDSIIADVSASDVDRGAKQDLLEVLREKQQQAQTALQLALKLSVEAQVVQPVKPESDRAALFAPGQKFALQVKIHNGSRTKISIADIEMDPSQGWVIRKHERPSELAPGADLTATFDLQVPQDAPITRPYWHRDDPENDALNVVDDPRFATLPFPPAVLRARVQYRVTGNAGQSVHAEIETEVSVPTADKTADQHDPPLAVAPALSVELEPGEQVIPTADGARRAVTVGVTSLAPDAARDLLTVEVPSGWKVDPPRQKVTLQKANERTDFKCDVFPGSLKEGKSKVSAVVQSGAHSYREGYATVMREDLDRFYYYQPAEQRVSIVNVQIPKRLQVGYIMGAGDEIPTVLQQIGINVSLIPLAQLATADLSQYGTIVLGIRAYDTQKELTANQKRLLEYVSGGGTLVVQYNTATQEFNQGHFVPYSAQLGRGRVSLETAPVSILEPQDPIFHYPNSISDADFAGWVQERGLYFMDQWSNSFHALLSSHDPGEPELKGGLIKAKYGKGTYIYTGYAFFRQLPAGVPGAIRLFVNLLAAGHEPQAGHLAMN